MKCILIGTIENVNGYEGRNGFGANITISSVENKRRESIEFNVKDKKIADEFEELLQEEISVQLEITQNKFGTRLGDVLSYSKCQ